MMLVTSGWILLAMPKSINFSDAFTMTKFAGFRSLWTIPGKTNTAVTKIKKGSRKHTWNRRIRDKEPCLWMVWTASSMFFQ